MTLLALTDPRPCSWSAPAVVLAGAHPPLPLETDVDPWPDAAPALPDEDRRTLHGACRALLEAMAGTRPLGQVEPWVTLDVLRIVARHARERHRLVGRTFRAGLPRDDVVEIALRVADAARRADGAVALRFERGSDGWVCTALELGPRPRHPAQHSGG